MVIYFELEQAALHILHGINLFYLLRASLYLLFHVALYISSELYPEKGPTEHTLYILKRFKSFQCFHN